MPNDGHSVPGGIVGASSIGSPPVGRLVELALRERTFLLLLAVGFAVAGVTYRHPVAGAWAGFVFASYSAVANDSIQTLGTFLSSNRDRPWWLLWLFVAGIFVATMGYSWLTYGGDVSYQRLAAKGFETAPTSFSYLQVAAPLFLLVLTRLKMPVSTTFLLLSGFATSATSIGQVLSKSLSGYVLALVLSVVLWGGLAQRLQRMYRSPAHPAWRVAQWLTAGFLWSVWLMQDAANVAVYLPRSLGVVEFGCFVGVMVLGLLLLFRQRGDRIQEIVEEKSDVFDVRAATLINLVFGGILLFFKMYSKMPMSTTWVFIGLLSGRELAMTWRRTTERSTRGALRLMTKDLLAATIGLLVSVALALAVNEAFREGVWGAVGLG